MKLAIVILNWNGAEMMRRYLPSVIRHSQMEGVEVIVADNASTDNSLEMLAQEFPDVPTVVLDQNYGFAGGYNKALKQIEADYFLLLNSDVEIRQPRWVEPMLAYMDAHTDVAACQPKLLKLFDSSEETVPSSSGGSYSPSFGGFPSPVNGGRLGSLEEALNVAPAPTKGCKSPTCNGGREGGVKTIDRGEAFEYAGAAGGFLDRYGYPFCRGRVFDTIETDRHQYDELCDLHWATGAALMVRAADFWAVGGLDEHFFAHMEEIDICWRLRLRGKRIVCISQSEAYHLGGATLHQGNPRKTFLNFRNNLLMLYKNLPEKDLKQVMRRRSLLDWIAALQFLLKLDRQNFLAIRKAKREFKKLKPAFALKRQEVQQNRVGTTDSDRCAFSLLWQYFFRRRKHFSQLPV